MRRLLDALLAAFVRRVLGVYYRAVEVLGAGRVPRDRPLVFVANHVNALVDPLLILGYLGAHPRFLAKSTLWENPFLRFLFALGGVVPVYRRQDEGVDTSRNQQTFDRCHRVLAAGGAIALFPEGTSHNEPSLLPLKTGAARIVLESRPDPLRPGVQVVPVGLVFDAKERFRSRALIVVGEPLDPASERERHAQDAPAAVRELTERIGRALEAVTLNYPSWEEARLIERAVDIYARPARDLPEEPALSDRFALRKAFAEGYRLMQERSPAQVEAVSRAVARYDRLLATFAVKDEQVAARYPLWLVLGYPLRALATLTLGLPLAALGTLLNWVPYHLPRWAAARMARERDQPSSVKIYTALFLFPLTWALEALLGWWLWDWHASAAVAVLAPLSGWVALRFHERRGRLSGEARAWLLLGRRGRLATELRARREEVSLEVTSLVRAARAARGTPRGTP